MQSAYERFKQLKQERENRKNQNQTWTNHFIDLKDGESFRLRFLFNILDEPNHEREMLALKMHDYFLTNENKYVRALCAEELNKPCQLCQQAADELELARENTDQAVRKAAMSAAYRKAARDHFILPCFLYTEETVIPKLLDLKSQILNDLIALYEEGIESEDEQGNVIKLHDITIGDFTYKRSGTGKDTRYSLLFTRIKPIKLPSVSRERILEMIQESRPARIVTSEADPFLTEDLGELDEYHF
ncbi:hypothetical protein EI42_05975 [Thermosporothrix hazakensis]|jgi:hypothetical protein|uniref:Uncharacterized protein n=3 Tax=Thermosporothrix hazakensis TaxID=644383 RepID=A0A326TUB0_THEHA|nr:hypothetical protein EI42_05975 [Thermosporothrix hazakensis]GCE49222.1 hypothetical protein KTH_40910 [Thermosporothrix hazakensis]